MVLHRSDVDNDPGRPCLSTADTTVTEWVTDLSIPGSSANPTRTTHPFCANHVAAAGPQETH